MISFSELLKNIIRVYFANFKVLLTATALSLLWNIALAIMNITPATPPARAIPFIMLSFLISAWTELVLVGTYSNLLQGNANAMTSTIQPALKKLPQFIVMLLAWGVLLLAGTLLLIIPGITFAVWFMFLGAAVMLEDQGFASAFKRSKTLVSGQFFPLLLRTGGVIILTIFIAGTASTGFDTLMKLSAPTLAPANAAMLGNIFTALLSALAIPIVTGTIVTLYYETRRIKGEV